MGGPYKFDSFRNSNWNSSGVETNTIMSDDYDMVRLMQENYRYIYYMNQNHNQTYTTF